MAMSAEADRLLRSGTGTLVLTGTNTYTGGTTIKSGALHVGDGGTKGSIVGNVVDDGALVFNRSDVVTFDGDISGTGAVVQAGSGTTILTGEHTLYRRHDCSCGHAAGRR